MRRHLRSQCHPHTSPITPSSSSDRIDVERRSAEPRRRPRHHPSFPYRRPCASSTPSSPRRIDVERRSTEPPCRPRHRNPSSRRPSRRVDLERRPGADARPAHVCRRHPRAEEGSFSRGGEVWEGEYAEEAFWIARGSSRRREEGTGIVQWLERWGGELERDRERLVSDYVLLFSWERNVLSCLRKRARAVGCDSGFGLRRG